MKYYISYNGKFLASRKSLNSAMDYITKKELRDDEDNILEIISEDGDTYTPDGELKEDC